jgi:salicylate hydroxylase
MSELKVAVVGGGIGGLVLALALRERGITFELYEQADELREVGAAVALSANGTRELRRLGVGERVEAASVIPSALVIRRWGLYSELAWIHSHDAQAGDAAHGSPVGAASGLI